jgi:hypothetical protein
MAIQTHGKLVHIVHQEVGGLMRVKFHQLYNFVADRREQIVLMNQLKYVCVTQSVKKSTA